MPARVLPCPDGSRFLRQTQGDMVEAALTMPLMVLLTLALVNFALVGHARNASLHAAHFGARMGSTAFAGAESQARHSAESVLGHCLCQAQVVKVVAADVPGGEVTVEVQWTVQNYFAPLLSMFGGTLPETFTGTASASYRKEGW